MTQLAVLVAVAGSMSLESPYSSLLCGSSTTSAVLVGADCTFASTAAPSSPALAGSGTRVSSTTGALGADSTSVAPSTPALGGEGLSLSLAGGALLRFPTSLSSSSCYQLCDAARSTLAGFNIRPGGALRAAPADLLLSIGPGGRRSAALAGVIFALPCLGLLGRQGPSSHRLSELYGLRL